MFELFIFFAGVVIGWAAAEYFQECDDEDEHEVL